MWITSITCAALASCVMVDDADETSGEDIASAETASELDQDAAAPTDLPRWRTHLRGKDALTFPFPPTPGPLDHLGGVIAIREGDEDRPERWVSLSLVQHWKKGDRYFEELMAAGVVTGLDLLMITSDLLQHGERLPPIPQRRRSLEDRGDWSPFPGLPGSPGDDHTGGPIVPRPRPGATRPRPANPRPGGLHPGPGRRPRPPRRPTVPAGEEPLGFGVERGDPAPVPSPFDADYQPRRGERREVFKCESGVYDGYRRACIDFQAMPNGVKWGMKLSGWSGRYFDPKNVAMRPADKEALCKWSFSAAILAACSLTALGCSVGEVVTVGSVTIPCWLLATAVCVGSDKTVGNILDCHAWAYR